MTGKEDKKKSALQLSPEIMTPRERARQLFYQDIIEDVVPLLEPILMEEEFSALYYQDYVIFIDTCFEMYKKTKDKMRRQSYLHKAMNTLDRVPDTYTNFIFDRGIFAFYMGKYEDAEMALMVISSRLKEIGKDMALYFAKIFYTNGKIEVARGLYYYVAGMNIPYEHVRKTLALKGGGHYFEDLTDYNVGYGSITLEEMDAAVSELHLYQKKGRTLERFYDFIIDRAIRHAMRNHIPLQNIGHYFYSVSNYNLVLMSYSQIPIDSQDIQVTRELARANYHVGNVEEAIKQYLVLLQQKSFATVPIYLELAEAYNSVGDFKKAIDQVSIAEKIAPADKNVLYTAGIIYYFRAQQEMSRSEHNLSIYASYLKKAAENMELFHKENLNIRHDQVKQVDAILNEWQAYKVRTNRR